MPANVAVSDESLLLSFIDRGDRGALAQLFERYQAQAFALARHAGLSHPDAEDAAQSAFVELLRSLKTFRRDARFAPWFFRIIVATAYKKRGTERQRQLRERPAAEALMEPRKNDVDPQLNLQKNEELRLLDQALGELPDNLQLPIVLRYRCGLDGAQAALVMGCPENTFRTWLKRGLEDLRNGFQARAGISRDDAALTGLLAVLPFEAAPHSLSAALGSMAGSATATGHSIGILSKGMAFMKAHPLGFIAASFGMAITAAVVMPSLAQRRVQDSPNAPIQADQPANTSQGKGVAMDATRTRARLSAAFCGKLGTLISSGVPPIDALKLVESECNDADLKPACVAILDGVEKGNTLGNEMAKFPAVFPVELTTVCDKKLADLDMILVGAGQVFETEWRYPKCDDPDREHTRQCFIFSKCFARFMSHGVSIAVSLNAIAGAVSDKDLAATAAAVEKDIRAGSSLSGSLAKYPKFFPESVVAMVSAGEATGTVDYALTEIANVYEREMRMEQKPDDNYRKTRDVAAILYALGEQLSRGKKLEDALERIANVMKSEPYHSALATGATHAREGTELSAIFQANPKLFGPSAIVMARAGEAGNVLGICITRLAHQYLADGSMATSRVDVDMPATIKFTERKKKAAEKKETDF